MNRVRQIFVFWSHSHGQADFPGSEVADLQKLVIQLAKKAITPTCFLPLRFDTPNDVASEEKK